MEDLRHRLTTQHEKDLNKLQTKLSKVEIARDELVKERNDVRNELGVLKVEVRASTSREAALRSSVRCHCSPDQSKQMLTDLAYSWINLSQRWANMSKVSQSFRNNSKP